MSLLASACICSTQRRKSKREGKGGARLSLSAKKGGGGRNKTTAKSVGLFHLYVYVFPATRMEGICNELIRGTTGLVQYFFRL
jgi:hypothetical protein